jgi:DNA transposition AAA+ family ATPase
VPKRLTAWYRKLLDLAELAGDDNQKQIAARMHVSEGAVSGWGKGVEPRIAAVRSAAMTYREFVEENTDELFRELLLKAYPPPHLEDGEL